MAMITRTTVSILLLLALCTAARAQDSATVASAQLGPALRTADGRTIALFGITMPTGRGVSPLDVLHHVEEMVKGHRVMILAADTARRHDSAFTAFVLFDNHLLNLELLRDGYASIDINAHHPYVKQFQTALSEAQLHRLGAWSDELAHEVQCSHVDPDGRRCSEMTMNRNGRCFKHQ
jgi:endonuclease YncB( thermonuclease family)